MSPSQYIKVMPMTSEAIQKAFSYGRISFETMQELLKEVNLRRELSSESA